ncbi:MAG: hypothetical protein ACOWYE_00940, partial [Desulfatiglandales bacterium]
AFNETARIGRNTVSALSGVIFNLKTAFAGLGLGLTAQNFVQAASTAEQFQTRLNVLLGSTKEGNRLFNEMADYAGKVSFRYEEIMSAATNLSGVMKGGVDEIKQWMPLIGDLAAATGLSIEDTTSQVIRMYSAGAASADMFRERGVLAMLGFQAGVSYSAEETRKRLMEAWKDPASQFAGAADELGKTWKGLLSMISDRWFQFRNMVMDQGVFDYFKALVSTFLDFINKLKTEGALDKYAQKMAENILRSFNVMTKGFAGLLEALRFVQRAFEGIKYVINTVIMAWATLVSKVLEGYEYVSRALGMKGIAGTLHNMAEGFAAVAGVAREEMDKSAVKMVLLAEKQGRYWNAVGGFIKDVEKMTRQLGETTTREAAKKVNLEMPIDPKVIAARQKAFLAELTEGTKTALLKLEIMYKNGQKTLEAYFEERKALISRQYEAEIAAAEKAAEAEADPAKRIALQSQAFKLRSEFNQALIELDHDRFEKERELEKKGLDLRKIMADLKVRAEQTAYGNLQVQFDQEKAEMDQRHQEEIESIRKLTNDKAEIEEAYRLQKMEKDKLMVDQERRLNEYRLQMASDIAGGMADIFEN